MELTDEMKQAFKTIEETSDHLFITGKAGTGKTTFLRYIVENSHKKLIVAAPTGIAAINAGGTTLHKLFNIPLEIHSPDKAPKCVMYHNKYQLFQRLETLIIDEASMLRPDILDYIDRKLRLFRLCELPFGGVQVVLFGDLFQLPPVLKKSEEKILNTWYRGKYFFHARGIRQTGFKIVELTHVFRQQDEGFVRILNNIRNYQLLPLDMDILTEVRDNQKSRDYTNQSVHICSLRRDVDAINQQMLGEATHVYTASVQDKFNIQNVPCPYELKLREGARVMALANDPAQQYYNGSMGTVMSLAPDTIHVMFDNGNVVPIHPFTWKDKEYELKNGEIVTKENGSCTQFPLTLGWAITIHKSQGLTFDKITIHCPYVFAPGMIYVALSRCTSMQGITTDFFIGPKTIIPDKELVAFNRACETSGNYFNNDVYRAFCRYMGYEND